MEPSLAQIAALVTRSAGLEQAHRRPWLLESRVAERRRALSCSSARSYLELLKGPDGDRELELLLEALRVGETRFFRQPAHLRALRRVALPELRHRAIESRRPLSIKAWSAGCATGEEPYSLAMVLLDWAAQRPEPWRVEVVATDLSPDALAIAKAGCYGEAALADLPRDLRARHIEEHDGAHRVQPALRRTVRFERRNLVTDLTPAGCDLVICCNVMIYLDRAAQRRVLERLVEALHPGGYLFLGSAESTRTPPTAASVALTTPDGTIYQRRAAVEDSDQRPPTVTSKAADVGNTEPAAQRPYVEVVRLEGSYDEAARLNGQLRGALERRPGALVIDLDGATFLEPACARVLHRAAMTLPADGKLCLVASQPAVQRWLRRQPLLAELPRAESQVAARALLSGPRGGRG